MVLRAAELRSSLAFQRLSNEVNEYGEPVGTYSTVATAKGKIERLDTPQENFQALQVNVTNAALIQCRWQTVLTTLTPRDRIVSGLDVYDIKAVIPDRTKKEVHFLVDQHVE